MWDHEGIAEALAAGLEERAAALDAEQAVRGLDAMSEVELHEPLASGLASAGFGVWREQPYPGLPEPRPRESARDRCDLGLTPEPGRPIADLTRELKQRDKASGTLFEPLVTAQPLEAPGVAPEDAFWLEVKTVAQHAYVAGVPGPNRAYASQLLACRADVEKLLSDDRICHGGLALVLFCEAEEVARHDAGAFMHRCLDEDMPLGAPVGRAFGITDRAGNACCAVWLAPFRLL